ncbi:hypothetical protein B9479_004614 [Cryptococcus floricola]|uniref:Uncharacterized protein n=1 Tax=Cryptococcus floricola TaxID=2591691 RepID=A0A5D3AXU8_9TREE|nr:hypothetical protein B9479_004614 [Cryptococcus floricola]
MSTRSNFFKNRQETYPLTVVPLTPAIASSTTLPTPAASQPETPSPSSSREPLMGSPRKRPHPRRQLSITVPPPSRTLQSLVVPVQTYSSQASSSGCLRSPFVLRGTTRSASPRSRAHVDEWDNRRKSKQQSKMRCEDPERMPTSATDLRVGRSMMRRPPGIVLAVLASVVFIITTFVIVAPVDYIFLLLVET